MSNGFVAISLSFQRAPTYMHAHLQQPVETIDGNGGEQLWTGKKMAHPTS